MANYGACEIVVRHLLVSPIASEQTSAPIEFLVAQFSREEEEEERRNHTGLRVCFWTRQARLISSTSRRFSKS
jgi:hypothetical protein